MEILFGVGTGDSYFCLLTSTPLASIILLFLMTAYSSPTFHQAPPCPCFLRSPWVSAFQTYGCHTGMQPWAKLFVLILPVFLLGNEIPAASGSLPGPLVHSAIIHLFITDNSHVIQVSKHSTYTFGQANQSPSCFLSYGFFRDSVPFQPENPANFSTMDLEFLGRPRPFVCVHGLIIHFGLLKVAVLLFSLLLSLSLPFLSVSIPLCLCLFPSLCFSVTLFLSQFHSPFYSISCSLTSSGSHSGFPHLSPPVPGVLVTGDTYSPMPSKVFMSASGGFFSSSCPLPFILSFLLQVGCLREERMRVSLLITVSPVLSVVWALMVGQSGLLQIRVAEKAL